MVNQTNCRILIIGIDGGTWDVLGPACDHGLMPNLNRFRDGGCWGTLRSTHPPVTPAAWAALMTGQNPGVHGVLGFQEYDPATGRLRLTNAGSIRTETLWQKLSRHGKRVAVVGVPMTYPPSPVNGILVSGFDTPSLQSEFTYPASFRQEILDGIPDFTFERRYRRKHLDSLSNFASYIKWLRRQADQSVEILRMAIQRQGPDIFMVVLRSFDELLHHFWKLLDFSHDTSSDPRDAIIHGYLRDLDAVIGELLGIAEQYEAATVLVSDHGGQAKVGTVYPNRVLRQLGYLRPAGVWRSFAYGIQRRLRRRLACSSPLAKAQSPDALSQQINLEESRAFVSAISIYGDLYVQEESTAGGNGSLTDQVASELRQVADSAGEPIFEFVETPRTLYGLDNHREGLPDLMIGPPQGYNMSVSVSGRNFVKRNSNGRLSGVHSANGMFGLIGPQFVAGKEMEAEIIDIAPTILAGLGLPVTEDMNGRVLEGAFQRPPTISDEAVQQGYSAGVHAYSEKEQDEIRSRLADLGYL